jgi:RimJ/RimL family protein N-acetyltransferase
VDITTPRLTLNLYTAEAAERVLAGVRQPDHVWAPSFPLFEEIDFLRALVIERSRFIDPGVFGHYQVQLREGNEVIGGAGFFGPPDDTGAVEIIFGLVPEHLGNGYAAEIVEALVQVATDHGARAVTAVVPTSTPKSHAALLKGGLTEVARDESFVHFARRLHVKPRRPLLRRTAAATASDEL